MRDISARELKGHNILAVERYWDNTRWMIEFSVLRPSTAYGSPGDEMRLFLTEDGYQAALQSQQRREIKIKRYARVIEGHVLDVKKNGENKMFREKEICNAIRTAYLYLFPDKKERKRAVSRLNMELVAQSVRYRGESVLAYQTAGNHECSLNYYGPELFPQRGFCIYQKTIQSHSTQVDASCIRELWLLEDGRFVDVSCVNTKYRSAYERFSTCYRTIHHIVRERDWQDYPAEEVADAFEDISRYPFDGRPGVFYEV